MKSTYVRNTIFTALVCSPFMVEGQIFTQSSTNGSITITPKGLQGPSYAAALITNVALGNSALGVNTIGYGNTAAGSRTLFANTNGFYNTALGFEALHLNESGDRNTAAGSGALYRNTSGYHNTALGHDALFANRTGYKNASFGRESLLANTNGYQNTAGGHGAGQKNRSGTNNTFLGFNADAADTSYNNATAIGASALVDASNKVRIGNGSVTVIEGQVPWSNPSDRRLKENILYTHRLGLDFISRLNTVSYSYKTDRAHTRYDGFIAQDIEAVMKELNVPFSGLKKSDDGTYSLAYSDFVMPLVNAVKELKQKNELLEHQVQLLAQTVADLRELKAEITLLKAEIQADTNTPTHLIKGH